MTNTLYLPELREMLADNNSVELEEFCTALHPARTAEFMEGLTGAEAWAVLMHADPITRGQVFGYFDFEKQLEIIQTSDRVQIGQLIAELPADDRVDILKEVPHETVEQLLPLVPPRERRDIIRLLAYPEGTAGAMMTTSYARLREGMTVRQALDALGREAEDIETIYYVFVLDADEHLRGVVSARQLISAVGKPTLLIDDLMERAVVSVDIADSQELVAQRVAKYDLHAIPVVDHEHHMLGIITHDDVIDVVAEEATEDAYRMAAIEPMEENYLEAPFADVWKKRSFWLLCLFVAQFLTFTAMTYFESEMKRVFVLSLFVPWQQWVAGGNADYPRDGTGTRRTARLDSRVGTRNPDGPRTWRNAGHRRFCAGRRHQRARTGRGPPMVDGLGRRTGGDGHLPLGHDCRFDVADVLQATGVRPRLRLNTVRGHLRGRHRDRDLLHRCQAVSVVAH